MPNAKTAGNAQVTPGNEADLGNHDLRLQSDFDVLRYTAGQVEDLIELVRDRCDALEKRIGHVDDLVHQVDQRVTAIHADLEKYKPLLEKYSALQSMFKPKGPRRG